MEVFYLVTKKHKKTLENNDKSIIYAEHKMKKLFFVILTIINGAFLPQNSFSDVVVLDFEGITNNQSVGNYYNGGLGPNYGIIFSDNTLALVDEDAGGNGNFGNEPSPSTVMFFLTGYESKMTVTYGFDTGFSFWYSAINNPGSVGVYDINDALLATLTLPTTYSDGGDPNGAFSPLIQLGVSFHGTASYVSFSGVQNQIVFDDITFGSSSAGGDPSTLPPEDPINLGSCSESLPNKPCSSVGNPINAITGNKIQLENDVNSSTGLPYGFARYYNSQSTETTTLGANWRNIYDRFLIFKNDSSIQAYRPDGQIESFSISSEEWKPGVDTTSKLSAKFNESNQQTGWELVTSNDTKEIYDMNGRLVSISTINALITSLQYDANNRLTQVTGPFGHALTFTYNTDGLLSRITDPAGNQYQYTYDYAKNLTAVRYPDNTTRQYAYNDANDAHNLTGITDENGVLYATWAYDEFDRAISSEHAGAQEKVTIDYSSYPPVVTNALGRETSYRYTDATPLRKLTGRNILNCSSGCGASTYNYTSNGFLVSKTDPNGVITTYSRNTDGLETARTEAYGTDQSKTIKTSWHDTLHLPITVEEPRRTTTFAYDDKGNLLSKTVSDDDESRTWLYSYNDKSQLVTATDPRGGVTTYTYNNQGGVATVTNPLGHVTQITSYDANGNPLNLIDPNSLATSLTYDVRGRLTSVAQGNETTRYTYDNVGNIIQLTQPDGASITLSYDTAHRLTAMRDTLGNRIVYALDANGNKTKEEVFDNSGQLSRAIQHSYDTLNRLVSSVGSQGQTVTHTYDANGNLLTATDPLSQITTNSYDGLNRLVQIIDPANGQTTIGYNSEHISPSSLTDPRNITTKYTVNGFDEQTKVVSKETGTTSRTFDKAGNLVTTTDARGKTTTYSYDALNRMTGATFDGGSVVYQYDQGANGIGRLSTMTDPGGTTTWAYDAHGRITRKQQSVNGVTSITSYQYNQTTGRLISTTYPSGKALAFSYNTAGQVTRISVDGATLIDNITHQPFAFPASWSQGNGANYSRSYNQDGRIVGISIGGTAPETVGISYDAAGRIIQISDSSALPVTADNESTDLSYYTNKNQILSKLSTFSSTSVSSKFYTYDGSGNITSDGSHDFSYDGLGRLIQVASDDQTTQYRINGFGQRVGKASTVFVYDESGHLIGEYNSDGSVIQETVWLGDLPVAVLTQAGKYYINPDQIGAPLSITNSTGAVVWRWDHDPYGRIQPNQNPNSLGTFVYNLRFPGQYYDQESGLHYNWHRFYDPAIGRYVTADPIGLNGGINLYGYSANNPISLTDRLGLSWYDDWHFENRDEKNINLPESPKEAFANGATLLPKEMAIYHDDPNTEGNEYKFIFPDGREAVYYNDTGKLVTDPRYKGTYNYVNPAQLSMNPLYWPSIAARGTGHFFLDIAPYYIWGNTRKTERKKCE